MSRSAASLWLCLDGSKILGSNPRLIDRELKIDAAKPFRRWSKSSNFTDLRAFLQEVRTFVGQSNADEVTAKIRMLEDGLSV